MNFEGRRQWRKFIKNRMVKPQEKIELYEKIKTIFNSSGSKQLLNIINKIDHIAYDHIAATETDEELGIKKVYKHCFKKFSYAFEGAKKSCFGCFFDSIREFKSSLPVAGVVLVNEQRQMLLVKEIYGKKKRRRDLNFPMGKLDHDDNGDLKKTAIRELEEETGVALTEDEAENVEWFTSMKLDCSGGGTRPLVFYILKNFRGKVDVNREKRGEIGGLAWVDPCQVSTFER